MDMDTAIYAAEFNLVGTVVDAYVRWFDQYRERYHTLAEADRVAGKEWCGLDLIADHDRLVSLHILDEYKTVEETIESFARDGATNDRAYLIGTGMWAIRRTCREWIATRGELIYKLDDDDLEGLSNRYGYGHRGDYRESPSFWCEAIMSHYSMVFMQLSATFDYIA